MLDTLDSTDLELIAAAQETLRRNYTPVRHTVAAAARMASGRIFTGINIEACAYGPCAEPIALGAAFTAGERTIVSIVAVNQQFGDYPVLSPCGNCRQLLYDYQPDAWVIFMENGKVRKAQAHELLPGAYYSDFS